MENLNEIPGFLPEDYDEEPKSIENEELDDNQLYWLHHYQVAEEDGAALGEQMAAEYDSYIVIGFKKEKRFEDGNVEHESVCGACHIDFGDYNARSEMSRMFGYFARKNPELTQIFRNALDWEKSLMEEEYSPEPPEHKYLPRDKRFHQNRYDRIHTEEFVKVQDKFREALGDYKLRRDMKMKMVLTAIADQLNDNEPAEIDFFCNFVLGEKSDGDNVSGIDIRLRPYPCTWDEADANRSRFIELCKEYDVPCNIEWLKD